MSNLLAQALVNGVIIGLLYMLMAVGFTLVFGVMRIVNFAHGEFYMVGAFATYVLMAHWEFPFLVAMLGAFVVTMAFGWIVEWTVLKPFRHDELNGMIATIGVAMILQSVALLVFGPDAQIMPQVAEGVYRLGPVIIPASRLYVAVCSVIVLAVLYVFLIHTRQGKALRAVVQDMEIAMAQGIKAKFMYPLGFSLGVGLAAIAGALMAPLFSVSPFIGSTPLLKAFIVVILGGLGSIPGAALASLLLGITESLASSLISNSLAEILIFVVVMAILVARPAGLLGKSEA
ncbi:branched-chain amino acid ABC transporter permease [Bordetella tumulicola]|uniref:branched-chain amino acid ABC transporter permease n=1 Tax=Bordetella tumulicola TaxID=1649133 RepID=UPI0039F055BE